MSNQVKLEIYKFELKRYKSDLFLNLDSFFEENDFKDFFVRYITDIDQAIFNIGSENKTIQHHLRDLKFSSDSRMISGIVEGGVTGEKSNIVDIISGQSVFQKIATHTDTRPYYFLISAPENQTTGFIAIQRTGTNTIATPFLKHFRRHFRTKYPKVRVYIDKYISKGLVDKFLAGEIKELILSRTNAPADVADKLIRGHVNSDLNVKVTLSGLDTVFRSKIHRFMEHPNRRLFGIQALKDLGMDGNHQTQIKVVEGYESRTIDLQDCGNLNPYYYIDDKVVKDADGVVTFSSIDTYTRAFIEALQDEIFN